MVDISEKIGRVSCSELQKEFSANDVIFLPTDVTKRDQLVGHVVSQARPFFLFGVWLEAQKACPLHFQPHPQTGKRVWPARLWGMLVDFSSVDWLQYPSSEHVINKLLWNELVVIGLE